ncbi:tyramine beta-hydroxylase-like [Physella acuta]|uniref:tyramine beta-hydroxylase-like n=1 Tax=Physella acuta TaxID=109671 RepID=UPI0027DD5D19|nr:tyramine beta-hydroxylase-like [Physella acuta]
MFGVWCLTLLLCLGYSEAHQYYQDRIPNGHHVPHPCIPTYGWPGVGHQNQDGGGARNRFGEDFATAGHKWTQELCRNDSDNDGLTNGQELGDPDCVWTPHANPTRVENVTHPGVCEPVDGPGCQNRSSYVSCQRDAFELCDAIRSPDVRNMTLTLTRVTIPPTGTSYICQSFDLPSDQSYHIVADQPIVDNRELLHHMLLFGCLDEATDPVGSSHPHPCEMSPDQCTSIIGGWTVGQSGGCYDESIGFRIGEEGFSRVVLQIHYDNSNNPSNETNITDASGLRLYYRPAMPTVQDLITFVVGQEELQIPPGQSRVEQSAVCPSDCTSIILKKPAFIVSVHNHMHYLGREMNVSLYRNGSKVKDLSKGDFSYDSPVTHSHNPPVPIYPGDELRTTCAYSSLTSKNNVTYGRGTADEMCYGFLIMYPRDAIRTRNPSCISSGNLSQCQRPLDGCPLFEFGNGTDPTAQTIFTNLTDHCINDSVCRPECRKLVDDLKTRPCFQGEPLELLPLYLAKTEWGREFLTRLGSYLKSDPRDRPCTRGAAIRNAPEFVILATAVIAYVMNLVKVDLLW